MLLLSIHLMLATSLALLPSFLAGEEMDLLVKLVREQVDAMEWRVREEVIRQMEDQMEKREVLLMAEMERLEERLSTSRREKRQHPQKNSEKKTPKSDSSFTKLLRQIAKESFQHEQQTNESAQNEHTDSQFNSTEVKMTMMLQEQKSFLLNIISEREDALEERLVANYSRDKEEMVTRIDDLEEVLMQNISDRGVQHETWTNYEIENINGRISVIAEVANTAVDKIETMEKEIDRIEAVRLVEKELVEKMMVEKEMVEEQMRESERAMEVEVIKTKELVGEARKELEKGKLSVRKELADMDMQMRKRMEEGLIPLRSEVEI